MVKNSKLLISTAFISSLLIANIASAETGEDQAEKSVIAQKASMMSGNQWTDYGTGAPVSSKDSFSDWTKYSGLHLNNDKDIDAYDKMRDAQKDAWEKAGGAGTFRPGSKGAYLQKAGQVAWETTKFVAQGALACAMPAAIRLGGDFVIGHAAPYFVKVAGDTAEKLASSANDWWAHLDISGNADKAVRYLARKTAEGEALRDIGTVATMVQDYAVPAAIVLASVAKSAVTASWSTASNMYNWLAGNPSATAAEAM